MLGLRLTQEGVSAEAFHQRFGQDLMTVFGKEINELIGWGYWNSSLSTGRWQGEASHHPARPADWQSGIYAFC